MLRSFLTAMSVVLLGNYALASLGTPLCDGFGDVTCPCGPGTNVGAGCENESGTGGALLTITGNASLMDDSDGTPSVFLTMTTGAAGKTTVFIQGTLAGTFPFLGDGERCVGGSLVRVNGFPLPAGDLSDFTGSVTVPTPTGAHTNSVTNQCAALFQPIFAGDTRHYFAYYRDSPSNPCPPGSGNTTNAVTLVWGS